MKRCPYCMQNCIGPICPHCGNNIQVKPHLIHLPVGTLLNKRYEVGGALGQGGFGITYVAWDRKLQQRVAIKEYFPNRCTSQTRRNQTQVCPLNGYEQIYSKGMQTFAHEGQTLATIAHIPEVVHVLDGFHENNTSYIVMEFIEGKNLEKIVEQKGRMSADEVRELFLPLLHVMEQLHQMNITHRDISPDNIICMPNGTLKLIDFGSARQIENGKSVTVNLKAGFSPAEQYTSQGQGPWTDVYSMAATIYYCLTGTRPVSAAERLEDIDNVDPLLPPSKLDAVLTKEQEEVILWGMTVQPKQRPMNMSVFARQFQDAFPQPEPPKPEPKPVDPTYNPDEKENGNSDSNSGDIGKTVKDSVIEEQKVVIIDDPINPYDDPNKEKKPNWILLIVAAVFCVWLLGALVGALFLAGMYGIFKKDSKISTKGAKIIAAIAWFIVCVILSVVLSLLVSLL